MIKECKVERSHAINMVVSFDGVEVQLSNRELAAKPGDIVYVQRAGNKYTVVSKEDFDVAAKTASADIPEIKPKRGKAAAEVNKEVCDE